MLNLTQGGGRFKYNIKKVNMCYYHIDTPPLFACACDKPGICVCNMVSYFIKTFDVAVWPLKDEMWSFRGRVRCEVEDRLGCDEGNRGKWKRLRVLQLFRSMTKKELETSNCSGAHLFSTCCFFSLCPEESKGVKGRVFLESDQSQEGQCLRWVPPPIRFGS